MTSTIKQLPSSYQPIKYEEFNKFLNTTLKLSELPNNKSLKLRQIQINNGISFEYVSKYEFNK
jgi:hypothetical protein